jgi:hypothetical protein
MSGQANGMAHRCHQWGVGAIQCNNAAPPLRQAFVTEKVSKKKIVTIVQTALQLMVSSQ